MEFTEDDRKMLVEIYDTVAELRGLVKQVEPFLDSFVGGSGAGPVNPMNMIFKSLMGGK